MVRRKKKTEYEGKGAEQEDKELKKGLKEVRGGPGRGMGCHSDLYFHLTFDLITQPYMPQLMLLDAVTTNCILTKWWKEAWQDNTNL